MEQFQVTWEHASHFSNFVSLYVKVLLCTEPTKTLVLPITEDELGYS